MLRYLKLNIKTNYLTKSSNSKEWMICHYWFFNHSLEFQDSVCNGCHDLAMFIKHLQNCV